MKRWTISLGMLFLIFVVSVTTAQEKGKYPAPRFPSYVKPPKSIDDIMPFARAAVRQTGGRTPLGLVEKGTLIGIVTETDLLRILSDVMRTVEPMGAAISPVKQKQP